MITIDSREPTVKIFELLRAERLNEKLFNVAALKTGDYYIQNGQSIIFERKSISDFIGNWRELKQRLYFMKGESELVGLIIEGPWTVYENSVSPTYASDYKMPHDIFIKILTSFQMRGAFIYHTKNLRETIRTLYTLHEYLKEVTVEPPSRLKSLDMVFLSVPGISKKSLKKIKETYKSPREALSDLKWLPKNFNTESW